MCFEDVKMGRKTDRIFRSVTLGAAAVQLVKADARRIGLILFCHNTARYTLGGDNTVAVDAGPTMQAGQCPLDLFIGHAGALVTGDIWAIASAAATNVGVVEIYLPRDPQ